MSNRIQSVIETARIFGLPVLIFSGKYGLITPGQEIPWYDHLLGPADERRMQQTVETKLKKLQIRKIIFYAKPSSSPGWDSYHRVLAAACNSLDITLERRDV